VDLAQLLEEDEADLVQALEEVALEEEVLRLAALSKHINTSLS
jgi:hypothetical protein